MNLTKTFFQFSTIYVVIFQILVMKLFLYKNCGQLQAHLVITYPSTICGVKVTINICLRWKINLYFFAHFPSIVDKIRRQFFFSKLCQNWLFIISYQLQKSDKMQKLFYHLGHGYIQLGTWTKMETFCIITISVSIRTKFFAHG